MEKQYPYFLQGGGECGELARSIEWEKTAIGAPETWPQSLKVMAKVVLECKLPMYIGWGKDFIGIYNDAYRPILGNKHPAAMGASTPVTWDEIWPTIGPMWEEVIAGKSIGFDNFKLNINRYGYQEDVYFNFSYSSVPGDDGTNQGLLVTFAETTDRVKNEMKMRTEMENFRSLFEQSPEFFCVINGPELRFEYVNPSHKAIFNGKDLTGMTVPEAQPELAASGFTDLLYKVLNTGEPQIVRNSSAMIGNEERYFDLIYAPRRNIHGEVDGIFGLGSDVTDIIQARKSSERAWEELHSLFMQAPAPLVFLSGPEYLFKIANPLYESLVGRRVVGKTVREAFPLGEVDHFLDILDRVYSTGKREFVRESALELYDEQGQKTQKYVNLVYEPYFDSNGQVAGIFSVVFDVTHEVLSRRNVETLAKNLNEAVQARDQFINVCSHELNTPVTSLKLQFQMVQRSVAKGNKEALSEKNFAKRTELVLGQISRMQKLITDMLDVGRISNGKLQLTIETIDVKEIIERVVESFHLQLDDLNVKLIFLIKIEKAILNGDKIRLEQVFSNLISNALKFGLGRPITVSLSETPEFFEVSVADEGLGIAEGDQMKIFDKYERLDFSNKISGLGLGLFISKEIIEAHRGNIFVKSVIGKGSTFIVQLPKK